MSSKIQAAFKNVPVSIEDDNVPSPLDLAIDMEKRRIISKNYKLKSGKLVLKDDAAVYFNNFSAANFDPATIKFPGYPFLMSLSQNALIRNGVQRIANDMTKNWGYLVTLDEDKKEQIEEIEKILAALNTKIRFKNAQVANGYYGGALIYIEVTDENGEEPTTDELMQPIWDDTNPGLAVVKMKGKKVNRLKVIEPWNFTALGYNTTDPTHKDFYEPTYYTVLGKHIHASRFLRIRENYCPQILAPIYNFLGIPTAQLAFDYAYGFESARKSIVKLITKYSLTIFGTDIKPDENGNNPMPFIDKRVATMAKYRNNNSMVVYDKETEEMAQINTPISGLDALWMKNLELMTIPFQLPIVKLLGASPSGFSTGETELTNYYDAISTNQVSVFDSEMVKLAKLVSYTLKDSVEEFDISVKWNPIKTLSEKEIAEINKINAETDSVLLENNIISPEEARDRLSKSGLSDFNGINPDELPEVPEITEPDIPETDKTEEPDNTDKK